MLCGLAGKPYNDALIPGKYSKLVEPCDEVPSSSGVASYEDCKCKDRERVHRAKVVALRAVALHRWARWRGCSVSAE